MSGLRPGRSLLLHVPGHLGLAPGAAACAVVASDASWAALTTAARYLTLLFESRRGSFMAERMKGFFTSI